MRRTPIRMKLGGALAVPLVVGSGGQRHPRDQLVGLLGDIRRMLL